MVPLLWTTSEGADTEFGPALRLNINSIDKQLQKGVFILFQFVICNDNVCAERDAQSLKQQQKQMNSIVIVDANSVLHVVAALAGSLDTLIDTVDYLAVQEEQTRIKKQEDAKKV